VLYDRQAYEEAADLVWEAEQIPSTDLDLAFAARVLAKGRPRKAIRLLTAVLENNRGKAVQNLGMANALLHHGMVLQAVRFYGAALEADPTLANPDLEHFTLWSDDERTLWGDFQNRASKLGDLPWMVRDAKEALKLTTAVSEHTTPIFVPNLLPVPGEQIRNEFYQQTAEKNARITPPPAVTIPIDRVNPKDRLIDATYGAAVVASAEAAPPRANPAPPPARHPAYEPSEPFVATPLRRPVQVSPPPVTMTPSQPLGYVAAAPAPIAAPPPTTPVEEFAQPARHAALPPVAAPVTRRLLAPALEGAPISPPARSA
jgi:hypothetical protein